MIAYLLLTAPGTDVNDVVDRLRDFEAVVEAGVVYGDCDVVAKVVAVDQAELDEVVMERIHEIPGVESTRTFIAIPSMYWTREPAVAGAVGSGKEVG